MYYVYLLECADGTLYCGYTDDLERRVKTHNDGKGAKYTRARRPVKAVYHETYEEKAEAMRREYQIKKLSRADKEKLIAKMRRQEGETIC